MLGIPPPIAPPWMRDKPVAGSHAVVPEGIRKKTIQMGCVAMIIMALFAICLIWTLMDQSSKKPEPGVLNRTVEESRVLIGHDSLPAKSTGSHNTIIGGSHKDIFPKETGSYNTRVGSE